MDTDAFWQLIDRARAESGGEPELVVEKAVGLLAAMPAAEIVAARQILREQFVISYTAALWAAAYVINGGCSDDGFEYFRGWLITQGRDVFERAVADPESLAGHPAVMAAAGRADLECEAALGIAYDAYLQATGAAIPPAQPYVGYPELTGEFRFSFEDGARLARMLPRICVLYDPPASG